MLHTPIYDVRGMPYCGPTAIAAVTGEPISHYHREVIRTQTGTQDRRCWDGSVTNSDGTSHV